jgi:hypothetical protein
VSLCIRARSKCFAQLLKLKELPTVLEQVRFFLNIVFQVDVGMQITWSVQFLHGRQVGHPWRVVLSVASGSATAVIPTIIIFFVALVIAPISVIGGNHVGAISCFVAATSSPFAAILSAPRVIQASLIAFAVVVAWAGFPHVVFAISQTTGGLHQFGDGLG